MARPNRTIAQARHHIESNVHVNEVTGCWDWKLSQKANGYGAMRWDGDRYVHRVSARVFTNQGLRLTEGAVVMHMCNNKRCCNPAHLKIGTQSENQLHAVECGRHVSHIGAKNGYAKLDADKVMAIRRMRADGYLQREIAAEFNVTTTTVHNICKGKSWKHLPLVNKAA